ncbi:MAG: hypothetical protein HY725_11820 [Candidatus Rokubacteria bacterium]|nr:hypothetical protein [Candidatus Rokubacteria bacterium]
MPAPEDRAESETDDEEGTEMMGERMLASQFITQLRREPAVHLRGVALHRPALNCDELLNPEPLLVMASMLGEGDVLAALEEIKGKEQHTYYVATGDRFLQVAARLVTGDGSKRVDVEVQSYALSHLRVLAFDAACVNGPQRASARLDFGQAEPIKLTATNPEEAKALQHFVGVLCALTGRGTTKPSEA